MENGHWIWFGFTAGLGRDTSANLIFRIVSPEPVDGLLVSPPTSESLATAIAVALSLQGENGM